MVVVVIVARNDVANPCGVGWGHRVVAVGVRPGPRSDDPTLRRIVTVIETGLAAAVDRRSVGVTSTVGQRYASAGR
jgi:hypothetical protein